MSSPKVADLSAGLVAIKGKAEPAADMPPRAAAMPTAAVAPAPSEKGDALQPLNFKVGATFRTAFKTYAAQHNLKLNELLRRSFESYRRQQGDEG